jgi:hypothetical protein
LTSLTAGRCVRRTLARLFGFRERHNAAAAAAALKGNNADGTIENSVEEVLPWRSKFNPEAQPPAAAPRLLYSLGLLRLNAAVKI